MAYVSILVGYLMPNAVSATRVMQSSSNELSTLVSDSAKCKQTKANTCVIIPEQTYVTKMVERLDTMSSVVRQISIPA